MGMLYKAIGTGRGVGPFFVLSFCYVGFILDRRV